MKIPNPRRYRRLLAAREERARRNYRRELRRHIARCERLLDSLAERRDAAPKEFKREYARLWMMTLKSLAELDVELTLAP